MKWFPLVLFVLLLLAGYSPQFRSRLTPAPALVRVWRKAWAVRGQHWAFAVAVVRIT